jgi:hypothetical protein
MVLLLELVLNTHRFVTETYPCLSVCSSLRCKWDPASIPLIVYLGVLLQNFEPKFVLEISK